MQTNSIVVPSSPSVAHIKAPTPVLKLVPPIQDAASANYSGQKLLNALWRSPDKIYQIGSLDRQSDAFKNTPVKNAYEALQLSKKLSDAGIDAYFACAVYTNADSRKASNAAGAYGFLADIDCGEAKAASGKGYLTEADALVAVKKFCDDAGLPMPTHIVSSGGGLHIYWVLDSVVDRGTWQAYAGKLKTLTKALGFLADDSRTSDIASVLRVPGTLNFKYQPPKPVTLLQGTDTFISQVLMLAAIESAVSKQCPATAKTLRAPSPKISQATSNDDADTSDYGPPDLETLASALTLLDPDCEESIWTLERLAPLARAARQHPELAAAIYALAKSWSSGEIRGEASRKWCTPGCNGKTGEQAFEGVWQRFLNEHIKGHTGSQTTLGTIYHAAKEAGWIAAGKAEEQFQPRETIVIEPAKTPIAAKTPSVKSIDLLAGDVLSGSELTVASQSEPAATTRQKSTLSPLATVQQLFCMIKVGGAIWIIDGHSLNSSNNGTAQKLVLFNKPDGALMIRRAVAEQFPGVDPWTIGSAFLINPQTICYNGVEFNPCSTTGNYLMSARV